MLASLFSSPDKWAVAISILIGTPLSLCVRWLWKQFADLRKRVDACEQDRAVLHEKLNTANENLAVERGRVNVLTDLFKKEANLG